MKTINKTLVVILLILTYSTSLYAKDSEKLDKAQKGLMAILESFNSKSFTEDTSCDEESSTSTESYGDSGDSSLKFDISSDDTTDSSSSGEVANVKVSIKDKFVTALDSEGNVIKTFPCATGRAGHDTPKGSFKIISKLKDPDWDNPFTRQLESVPAGPDSPIGTRFMGFKKSEKIPGAIYGFHGTNNPNSIGTDASSGCIRMYNKDVEEFFGMVEEGTTVTIE